MKNTKQEQKKHIIALWLESVGNNGLLCYYVKNKKDYYIRLKIQ